MEAPNTAACPDTAVCWERLDASTDSAPDPVPGWSDAFMADLKTRSEAGCILCSFETALEDGSDDV
jgi:hypothetical protein